MYRTIGDNCLLTYFAGLMELFDRKRNAGRTHIARSLNHSPIDIRCQELGLQQIIAKFIGQFCTAAKSTTSRHSLEHICI